MIDYVISILILLITGYISFVSLKYICNWRNLPVHPDSASNAPLVSIIVPMRNEEKGIISCLESLCVQSYKNKEIIVVDDCSEDTSCELVREYIKDHPHHKIRLFFVTNLPNGWVGKCNAIMEAIKQAQGEWFLFTDADVIHENHTLSSAIEYLLKNNEQFLSLKFRKICKGFWEKVIVPYTYFVKGWFSLPPSKIADMNILFATATGDYIIIKRDAYLRFGGHGHPHVKNHLVEDAAIARVAKQHGIKPVILDGKNYIYVRKFNNIQEIFAGFGKIIAIEFQRSFFLFLKQIFWMLIYSILPFVFLFIHDSSLHYILHWSIVALVMGVYMYYLIREKHPFYEACLMPLGAVMLIIICIYSFLQASSRQGVMWRGRQYDSKGLV